MPFLRVLSPGFLTTVQDLGRRELSHLGVSPAGAADDVALRLGNLLVENEPGAAALEMTLVGGSFRFESETVIALTGSDFQAMLDGEPVSPWTSFLVRSGQVLRCGPTKSGARCYLCILGGIDVPRVLGSASTHLMTGLGGLGGRSLLKGDIVSYGLGNSGSFRPRRLEKRVMDRLAGRNRLRVTVGPEADLFSDGAIDVFTSSPYMVTEEANRMGLRLAGAPLKRLQAIEMITEGVSLGAVQVTHDGEPIILFVDHQTTGGYPKIANIASVDVRLVGQLRPRDEVRFELITIERALSLLVEQESLITPNSLRFL